jgi:hypothetical protein
MTFYGSGEATLVPGAWPSAPTPFEPTVMRPITAPQDLEPTMMRPITRPHHVSQPASERVEAAVEAQPTSNKSRSGLRAFGRIFDWISISLMGLLVCAFICQQGFGVFHTVETAASFPLDIAVAASTTVEQQGAAQRYVDHTEWTIVGNMRSLRVYPTAAGRQSAVGFVDADDAWAQVVRLNPDANTAGMREQFVCHLRFAEFAEPGKVSWNLEPWRPIVNGAALIESRCNPGGPEEQL